MARISEKNRRFRSKKTICDDLEKILDSELSYGTKFAVVSEITWVWSEFNGKHQGCQFWSKEALQSGFPNKHLVHEHLVPKRVLVDAIIDEIEKTPDSIYDYLERFCIGVVVTKDEDARLNAAGLRSKMPENWDTKDPWARYNAVGIKVERATKKPRS